MIDKAKIDYKIILSDQEWFSIEVPSTWKHYDDDDENGTYSFFDSTRWTGNLRVTPFKWTSPTNQNKAKEMIDDEIRDNKDAIMSKIGIFDCASYKKYITQDNDELVMYYWMIGNRNELFTCSFCISKEMEATNEHQLELEKVKRIISTIKSK